MNDNDDVTIYDALGQIRRLQRERWAKEAERGYATPDTDDQLSGIWEARELMSAVACALASLQADRPHDPNLGAAIAQLTNAHYHVYQVECSRHREVGSVAPGERKGPTYSRADVTKKGREYVGRRG